MFGSTAWLTLVTLIGLLAGFAREWMLITYWGGGVRTDTFLIAAFLPEAVRIACASGLFSAAALPIYSGQSAIQARSWLNSQYALLFWISIALIILIQFFSYPVVFLLAPGLEPQHLAQAADSLKIMSLCFPPLLLWALFSIPLHREQKFILVGLGSLLYNLPAIIYLSVQTTASTFQFLAWSYVCGSSLMVIVLMPQALRSGWHPWRLSWKNREVALLYARLWPLLISNLAGQGIFWLEKLVASLIGEGFITWMNLTRKLMGLPLLAIMSMNQVLFPLLIKNREPQDNLRLLNLGLGIASILTLPTAVTIISCAPALTHIFFKNQAGGSPLAPLLALASIPLLAGCWNTLLARNAYAQGDTKSPLYIELTGSACTALCLITLPWLIGYPGLPLATFCGVITTSFLLINKQGLLNRLPWQRIWGVSTLFMTIAAVFVYPVSHPVIQICAGIILAVFSALVLLLCLKSYLFNAPMR